MTPFLNVKKQDMRYVESDNIKQNFQDLEKQLYAVFNIQIYRQM